jgi:hypothetical protein
MMDEATQGEVTIYGDEGGQQLSCARLEAERAEVEAERVRLTEERAVVQEARAKLQHALPGPHARVKLNVGGQVFVTSLDTIRGREPRSFFAALFSGLWKADTDPDGGFFIDRYLFSIVTWTASLNWPLTHAPGTENTFGGY